MSKPLNVKKLDKKLMAVTKSKDSIQSLSLWIIFHKCHHKEIVETWLRALEKGTSVQRLTLFYVANDVLQQCKKKGALQYKEAFADVLERAVALVTDKEIKDEIERMIAIWNERGVYTSDFLKQLQDIICGTVVAPCKSPEKSEEFIPSPEIIANFKLKDLMTSLKQVEELRKLTLEKQDDVNCIDTSDIPRHDVLPLKVRSEGLQMSYKFNEFASLLQQYLESAEKEIVMRKKTLELLEQSKVFFMTQGEEVKNVAYAYKIFGKKVKRVRKQLNERRSVLFQTLMPCTIGGSPFPSDDNELSRSSTHSEIPVTHEAGDNRTLQSPAKNIDNSLDRRLSALLHDKYLPAQCNSTNVFETDNTPQNIDSLSLQTSDIECEPKEVTNNLMSTDVDQNTNVNSAQECDDQSSKSVANDFNCSFTSSVCDTSKSSDQEPSYIETQNPDIASIEDAENDDADPDTTKSPQSINVDASVTVPANSYMEVSTEIPSNEKLQEYQITAEEFIESDVTLNNERFDNVEKVPDMESISEFPKKQETEDPPEKSKDYLESAQIKSSDNQVLNNVNQATEDSKAEINCDEPVADSVQVQRSVESTQIHLLKSLLMLKSFCTQKSLKQLSFVRKNSAENKNNSCKDNKEETLPPIPMKNLMKILLRSLKLCSDPNMESKQTVNRSLCSKELSEESHKCNLSAPNMSFQNQPVHSECSGTSAAVPLTEMYSKPKKEVNCIPDKHDFKINSPSLQSTSNREVLGSISTMKDMSTNLIYSAGHLSNSTESSYSTLNPLCSLYDMPTMSASHFPSQISIPNFRVASSSPMKHVPQAMFIDNQFRSEISPSHKGIAPESRIPISSAMGKINLDPHAQSMIHLQSSVSGFEAGSQAFVNPVCEKSVSEKQMPKTDENLEVMDMDLCNSDDETNEKGM